MDDSGLSDLERDVLEMLLAGNDARLEQLRGQLDACRVRSREMTGVGFWTSLAVPPGIEGVGNGLRTRLSDVVATIEGLEHGAGFVLFIENGLLDNLEGFTYDEPWPDRIGGYSLRYMNEERDLSDLAPDPTAEGGLPRSRSDVTRET